MAHTQSFPYRYLLSPRVCGMQLCAQANASWAAAAAVRRGNHTHATGYRYRDGFPRISGDTYKGGQARPSVTTGVTGACTRSRLTAYSTSVQSQGGYPDTRRFIYR